MMGAKLQFLSPKHHENAKTSKLFWAFCSLAIETNALLEQVYSISHRAMDIYLSGIWKAIWDLYKITWLEGGG